MAGGRPSIYTPELIAKAQNYAENYADYGDLVPSIAGLACELGITRETCRAWGLDEDKQEFSVILDKIMKGQERKLINGGLKGDFNSPITKMMLTKHGYSDKVEQDNTSSDGSMSPSPTVIHLVAPSEVET